MKTIYLVRHAKAEEKTIPENDFGRSLTSKGILNSIKLGKRLKKMHIHPDLIISSPAPRALQTAKIIQEYIHYAGELILDKNIYDSSAAELLNIIRKTDRDIKYLMLVGHNPSFNELLHYFCKTDIDNIPKATAVGIKVSKKWSELSERCGKLLFVERTKVGNQ